MNIDFLKKIIQKKQLNLKLIFSLPIIFLNFLFLSMISVADEGGDRAYNTLPPKTPFNKLDLTLPTNTGGELDLKLRVVDENCRLTEIEDFISADKIVLNPDFENKPYTQYPKKQNDLPFQKAEIIQDCLNQKKVELLKKKNPLTRTLVRNTRHYSHEQAAGDLNTKSVSDEDRYMVTIGSFNNFDNTLVPVGYEIILNKDSSELEGIELNKFYNTGLNLSFSRGESFSPSISIDTEKFFSDLKKQLADLENNQNFQIVDFLIPEEDFFGRIEKLKDKVSQSEQDALNAIEQLNSSNLSYNYEVDLDFHVQSVGKPTIKAGTILESEAFFFHFPVSESSNFYIGAMNRVSSVSALIQGFQFKCDLDLSFNADIQYNSEELASISESVNFNCDQILNEMAAGLNAFREGNWIYTVAIVGWKYQDKNGHFNINVDLDMIEKERDFRPSGYEKIDRLNDEKLFSRNKRDFEIGGGYCTDQKGFCISGNLRALSIYNVAYVNARGEIDMSSQIGDNKFEVGTMAHRVLVNMFREDYFAYTRFLECGGNITTVFKKHMTYAYNPGIVKTDGLYRDLEDQIEELSDFEPGFGLSAAFFDFSNIKIDKVTTKYSSNSIGFGLQTCDKKSSYYVEVERGKVESHNETSKEKTGGLNQYSSRVFTFSWEHNFGSIKRPFILGLTISEVSNFYVDQLSVESFLKMPLDL